MKRILIGWKPERFPNYIAALRALGAESADSPENCDALLLPGGGDVHPRFYGQEIDGAAGIDVPRDEAELALARRFLAEGRPILGICRGLQLVNVALGGTLRQHIEGHGQVDGVDRIHGVRTDDCALRRLYGERFAVNSAHHQAVDRLGDGLRAAAWADDGTVEAARHEALPVFAVQWHPERLREAADGSLLLADFLRGL